jgi:hypothetical protein
VSGLVTLKGKIYAVGGETEGLHSCKSLECYDPDTDEWTTLAPLIESRFDPGIKWKGQLKVFKYFMIKILWYEYTTLASVIESRFDPCIHWRGNQRVVVLFMI